MSQKPLRAQKNPSVPICRPAPFCPARVSFKRITTSTKKGVINYTTEGSGVNSTPFLVASSAGLDIEDNMR